MIRFARYFALLSIIAITSGCATLPPYRPQPKEVAIPPSATATTLGKIAALSSPGDELTGFRLMPIGAFALDTRVQLAQRAEKTLDVQYYVLADDRTGRYLMRALRDAALRGVRVRILMDDLYEGGEDDLLLGLAATPNVEIRLFNPFPGGRAGFASRFVAAGPFEFEHLQHRMHNKLFIADNAMAVAGGRNIADEYFMRSESENFVDLDVFVCGSVVTELSDIFDTYWNSKFVRPLEDVAHASKPHNQLVADFKTAMSPENAPVPQALPANDQLGYGPLRDDLDGGRLGLIWGIAFAYADPPSKISPEASDEETVQYNLIELMEAAKTEVLISSPYLIPGKTGMNMMIHDRKNGVRVRIMTNSLASTDEPVVHIGYDHYRIPMLENGVELYELSTGRIKRATRLGVFGTSIGRLHAKIAVIDRQTVFLGSMNFDPRSAHENTELAIIAENGQLAREVVRVLDIAQFQSCYKVQLDKNGHLQWVTPGDTDAEVLTEEPDTSFWKRFELNLLSPLAPEELL
jgi:putative cardiolipin synthase